jgi:hypothetical protein
MGFEVGVPVMLGLAIFVGVFFYNLTMLSLRIFVAITE